MSRAWLPLVLLLVGAGARAAPSDTNTCPGDAELRRALRVDDPLAAVACRVVERATLRGALVPAAGGASARVVVQLVWEGDRDGNGVRGTVDLPRLNHWRMAPRADAWKIEVAPANLQGADWWRADVTATGAQDASVAQDGSVAQTMVAFFKFKRGRLRRLWTGLGDRHEIRRDSCRLDTVADFAILDSGQLARDRRTTAVISSAKPPAAQAAATSSPTCLAPPPQRQTFAVADDGIDADFTPSDEFLALARENHLLSLRARTSVDALGLFMRNSLAIVSKVGDEVMKAPSSDPDGSQASMTISGAGAYLMDSGGRSGLNWPNILKVVPPDALPLARALATLRNDEGAWIADGGEYGGCHQPGDATAALIAVADAWRDAGPAVRAAFQPVLDADLREMSGDACFCDGQDKQPDLQRALDGNAAIIKDLPGGRKAGRQLRSLMSDKYLRFNCVPG